MDLRTRRPFGLRILGPQGRANRPARIHQFAHEPFAILFGEVGICRAPQPAVDDDITPSGVRSGVRSGKAVRRLPAAWDRRRGPTGRRQARLIGSMRFHPAGCRPVAARQGSDRQGQESAHHATEWRSVRSAAGPDRRPGQGSRRFPRRISVPTEPARPSPEADRGPFSVRRYSILRRSSAQGSRRMMPCWTSRLSRFERMLRAMPSSDRNSSKWKRPLNPARRIMNDHRSPMTSSARGRPHAVSSRRFSRVFPIVFL